jgi:hypothetical protein
MRETMAGSRKHSEMQKTILSYICSFDIVSSTSMERDNLHSSIEAINNLLSYGLKKFTSEKPIYINFTGDGAIVIFKRSKTAPVLLAIEIIKLLNSRNIAARIGLHYGEISIYPSPIISNQNFNMVGRAINTCTRIMSMGQPNQILISEEFVKIYRETKYSAIFSDHGVFRLKGIDEEVRLFEVDFKKVKEVLNIKLSEAPSIYFPKVFISFTYNDEEARDIVSLVIKPLFKEYGWDVINFEDFHYTNIPIAQAIKKAIKTSDLAIFLITKPSPSVFYEIGIATAYNIEKVLISKQMHLPLQDISDENIYYYEHNSNRLKEHIRNIITKIPLAR